MKRLLVALLVLSFFRSSSFALVKPADRVYRNGAVFTADSSGSLAEAVVIRDGRIVYVGTNDGVAAFIGPSTKITDLKGGFLMPGLVDGHMHPLEGGLTLAGCNLSYDSLTIAELQQRVQDCLDKTKDQE